VQARSLEPEGEMGAFSVFLILMGCLTLFGSALSLGLTFLHSMSGDPWAPMRTGSFASNYIGVDLGIERLFAWLGWGPVWQAVMDAPLYHVLFILGILIMVLALAARGMSREG
jgi:hypothetical protein